jgi:hypothetical protein
LRGGRRTVVAGDHILGWVSICQRDEETVELRELRGRLTRGLVIAGGAAGFAVHQAVLANADFEHGLAKAAVLLALALVFGHFALCATVFGVAGSGGHISNVTLGDEMENVPLVTWGIWSAVHNLYCAHTSFTDCVGLQTRVLHPFGGLRASCALAFFPRFAAMRGVRTI